eukprot:GHRR01009967.1.p1 GENE.GHRR01009967.1~~GHRR01009967.1.p1  ORF type:complete len:374 (+),score=67.81 GHRR01009967.1:945-2066(+)
MSSLNQCRMLTGSCGRVSRQGLISQFHKSSTCNRSNCHQQNRRNKRSICAPVCIQQNRDDLDADKRKQLEDELRDPKNFVEYFLPRPLRLAFYGGSAMSCFVAALITAAKLIQEPALQAAEGSGVQNLIVDVVGLAVFAGLFSYDQQAAETRLKQRRQIRHAQIRLGDREVYVNEQGQTMSRLKEVNDEWILRRLERWGKRDGMPFIGKAKGAILQQLVQEQKPQLAVEVGTMAGYSAILIAQVLPEGGKLISLEKDLAWVLVGKRFLWQASQGNLDKARTTPVGQMVDVWWGDARDKFAKLAQQTGQQIDFLLLDGTPKETLSYLQAAEPYLKSGAVVVADNAGSVGGVFWLTCLNMRSCDATSGWGKGCVC